MIKHSLTAPRSIVVAVVGLLLCAGLPAWQAPVARAQRAEKSAQAEAKKHYLAGERLFAGGKFRAALGQYRKAYALVPAPELLFNIGQCHRNLGNTQEAMDAFERYLAKKPDARNRPAVERLIRELRAEAAKAGPTPSPDRPADKPAPPVTKPPPSPKAAAHAVAPQSSPGIDLSAPPPAETEGDGGAFYTRWWFWTGVIASGAAITGTVLYLDSRGGLPGSDLGNLDFPR